MATIVDYASLSQALQDWLARSDIASYADYFIQVAENRINRDLIGLNQGRGVRAMEASLSGTITNNAIAVPADYLGLKSAQISYNSNLYPLERKNEEYIYTNFPAQTPTGVPIAIARSGSNFIFGPYADSGYAVSGTYWQKAAALSSSNTVTWMVTDLPDALLAACMAACAQFVRDDAAQQLWNGFYESQVSSYAVMDKSEAWSGSSLAISGA